MNLRRISVVAVLALAACGSGDGGGLSKADYIAAADKLCLDFNTRAGAIAQPQSQQEVAQYLDKAIALAEETRTDLNALEPPEDGKAVHTALVASLTESTDGVRAARDAAERGDQAGFEKAMASANEVGQRVDKEAKAYGFKVCGSEDELPDT